MKNASNFFNILQGSWKLDRTITSFNKLIGTASGIANAIKINDSTLFYKEELEVIINNVKTKSHKQYLYNLEDGKLYKKFDDNTLFYQLIFKKYLAKGVHLCGKDLYKATYKFYNDTNFSLEYDIKGPRKDDVIKTEFLR